MTSINAAARLNFAPPVPARRAASMPLWRDLAFGPGPLWWRMLRWAQRDTIHDHA